MTKHFRFTFKTFWPYSIAILMHLCHRFHHIKSLERLNSNSQGYVRVTDE